MLQEMQAEVSELAKKYNGAMKKIPVSKHGIFIFKRCV